MNKIIPNEYKIALKIASYDVGMDDRLKLSAVLRYQQEAGEQHLQSAGMGWRDMIDMGMVFVASRWRVAIHRLPRMEEQVTLTTWHRDRKGPRFTRCYEWRDAEGALLIEGAMQFALVSVAEHRLLRGDEFMARAPLPDAERNVACGDPGRIPAAATAPAGSYTVRWSDIDRNGHMNNTHYADLMLDFAPAGRTPALVDLHFAGESRLGDTIAIACGDTDGVTTVVGDTDRGRTFAACIVWGEA
jgi:acyl-ACP thioesterase